MASFTDTTAASTGSTVELSRPIQTHKGELTSVTLREPTVRSYLRAGPEPFTLRTVEGAVQITYDIKAMIGFVSDISGLDPIILEQLPARDWHKIRSEAVTLALLGAGSSNDPTAP